MSPPVQFLELAPDIILSIFAHCDVSATCRFFHGLAFQKSVWVSLLDDLKRRSILDSNTPDLRDLCTDELITLVKGLLSGLETWSPADAGFLPEISKRIILHPTIPPGPAILRYDNEAKLVRGGRYVLFKHLRNLECWGVAEDRLVWKDAPALESSSVLAFAADDSGSQEDDSLVVLVCQQSYPPACPRKNYIEIVDLDLRKGTHITLLTTCPPYTEFDNINPFSCPAICGTLGPVGITSRQEKYLIVDWKIQTSFVLSGHQGVLSLIALIPRHIILKTVTDGGKKYLYLVPADEVMHRYGSPVAELNGPATVPSSVSVDDVPNHLTHRIRPFGNNAVKHFFEQMSRTGASRTRATHACGEVDLMDCGHLVDVAPYSGALTYATHRHINFNANAHFYMTAHALRRQVRS
ncbi:hypothetical protein FB451DRAFT_1494198 [Mycena latifolia]|nr:hypothetical protein FB451DRAFT_1494198 [Mycena latifolia]